ncbi:hypothetical protein DYB28_001056 [Aphanomyces astaci]|uniref:Uncharacterized protein n=1 Tax=Aphanomyces astaci TaxID=112090 RepID=A0A9X8DR08_APHAT|nr:hypothetical protein DYB28_001056 [Aphanomyces astaci]
MQSYHTSWPMAALVTQLQLGPLARLTAQRAPLSVCIDPLSVECIAYWEIGKTSHGLTEEDWKDFFLRAKDCDPAEPKLTVDYLVAAVQPTAARACVKERMKLNENRGLKKDACDIKRWLADYIRRYGEFEALMATRHHHVQNVASCDQDPQGWKEPQGRGCRERRQGPKSNFTQEKCACFKCLHNVFKCPKLADCEAKLLMERARSICQVGNRRQDSRRCRGVPRECRDVRCSRSVCGWSGSVVPPTTLVKLKKLGRNVLVTKLKIPIKVKGFVGPAHSVTEEATMDLRFETDAGPLMLTNVKCWVSTGDIPANVGDILLSRAIMYCTS